MNTQALLRRQLEREDLTTSIEQGRKVERALFRENSRSLDTLGNLLNNRHYAQCNHVRVWEKRNAYVPFHITPAGPSPHGWECLCDRCHEGVLRLLRDCGILPKGKPSRQELVVAAQAGRLRGTVRYRRDESDR